LNDSFILRLSEHFARRVETMSVTPGGRIRAVFELALGRLPTEDETQEWTAYAAQFGLENTCRLILNSNEFLFVD
jgi:hypothetical protein